MGVHFFRPIKQVLWAPWTFRRYKHNGLSAREHLDRQVSCESACDALLPGPKHPFGTNRNVPNEPSREYDRQELSDATVHVAQTEMSADLSRLRLNVSLVSFLQTASPAFAYEANKRTHEHGQHFESVAHFNDKEIRPPP